MGKSKADTKKNAGKKKGMRVVDAAGMGVDGEDGDEDAMVVGMFDNQPFSDD